MIRWFQDHDGVDTIWKDPDSTKTYTIDVSRRLGKTAAGAQILISGTSTWAAENGLSIVGTPSNSTTVLTIKVTKDGDGIVTVATNQSDTEKFTFRWKARDR
jgi:hypothetical protein